MKGQIKYGKEKLSSVWIKVYGDSSSLLQKLVTDKKGRCAFKLPLQKNYTIKISKQGFVTKIVAADTRVRKLPEGNYFFKFTVDLFEEIPGLDVSVLKEPIAKIFFNTFSKNFEYDYNYTAKINNDVKKLYSDYYSIKHKWKEKPLSAASGPDTIKPKITQVAMPDTLKRSTTVKTPNMFFSVQILSSAEALQKNSAKFKAALNVKEFIKDGIYNYYIGQYNTCQEAKKLMDDIRDYFPDAFIIVFVEGMKIPDKEASEFIDK